MALWFDVHEDKRTRLERHPRDSQYWHRRLPREENSAAKSGAENFTELYDRPIRQKP